MKIIKKTVLADTPESKIVQFDIQAGDIAETARPGQFVVVMATEQGERIPLTVVNAENELVTLIFQQVGLSTTLLANLEEGNSVYAITGPLGHPTPIKKFGKVIVIGGGVGIAEIFPVIKALKNEGNTVTSILGARNEDLLILKDDIEALSDIFIAATDDGSFGIKGYNTELLEKALETGSYDLIYSVGPIPMMKKVCDITRPHNIKTLVSLNALMLDGTGMCGCCRVTVDKEVKFACVDGPEFDGHMVDWQELEKKIKMYMEKEAHICKLLLK